VKLLFSLFKKPSGARLELTSDFEGRNRRVLPAVETACNQRLQRGSITDNGVLCGTPMEVGVKKRILSTRCKFLSRSQFQFSHYP